MIKNTYNVIKSKSAAILALIMAVCVCFTLLGCNKDYTVEDAANIAREKFGCTKILWVSSVGCERRMSKTLMPTDGGYYVVGLDENGDEVYVAVPKCETDKYKITEFDWQFGYTFSQISTVLSAFGYEYKDGVDGIEDDYFRHSEYGSIRLNSQEDLIKTQLDVFGDAEELYEKLDVKLMFEFFYKSKDGVRRYYFLMQEGGLLKLYEIINGDLENFTVTIYGKDNI